MKIHLVKDTDNKVVATFEKAVHDGPSIKPHLPKGHTIHEVEVEEDYHRDIMSVYHKHSH